MARSRADLLLYRFKAGVLSTEEGLSIVKTLDLQSEGVYEVKARR